MDILHTNILYFIFLFVGLGFRPQPPLENVESTLIWYRGTDSENFKYWIDSLESFLKGNIEIMMKTYTRMFTYIYVRTIKMTRLIFQII